MERKQILRVKDADDDLIVKMSSSQVNYADERFYHESFGENQDFHSEANTFPVKVVTLRIGWIMTD